ncbi:hypothetical protein KVT40_000995 [Elsinoe batatas]|uniref:CCZ1/INTU/HSP4 first Longin domain-containing protein n=1 Tax=Elsinoe batatas TaxID=2601811 RepID=A0A8K0LD27_9PEZI|nr:hypothetical protein KVT40_000995 [Elsinoe batatas]
MTSPAVPAVIPAQLSFLAIYNPSLGRTDETFRQQLLFWYSRADRDAKLARKAAGPGQDVDGTGDAQLEKEQENERLRQIGLAQGMVDFARTFSDGEPTESVETEKSRVVLKEVERGWWVLASVDLTRLPKTGANEKGKDDAEGDRWEYSAREVATPALLVQQILGAHRTFLLHHGPSLEFLFARLGRDKLCSFLDKYWGRFCRYWEVLLHGNPAADVLGGLKLSAGGELGMGVGEEDWGSGERAVLEALVHNTEGMVDMVVSRFGNPVIAEGKAAGDLEARIPWLGRGRPAEASDGVIFGGTGSLSRASVRDISNWVQQVYVYGEHAYGVKDHPSRKRRRLHRRAPSSTSGVSAHEEQKSAPDGANVASQNTQLETKDSPQEPSDDQVSLTKVSSIPGLPPDDRPAVHDRVASQDHAVGVASTKADPTTDHRPGIPPPIVKSAEQSLREATTKATNTDNAVAADGAQDSTLGISNEKWVTYLTFGLNKLARPATPEKQSTRPSAITRQSTKSAASRMTPNIEGKSESLRHVGPMPDGHLIESRIAEQIRRETDGYFLIGYKGTLSNDTLRPEDAKSASEDEDGGDRTVLRTIHVETIKPVRADDKQDEKSDGSSVSTFRNDMTTQRPERLRVLIYVRRPFIFAFLFEQRQESLQMTSFYSNLHRHLTPLQKPMSASTSSANVAQRIEDSQEPSSPETPNGKGQRSLPVYDLLFDPVRLTVHSSIPNIPLPGTAAAEGFALSPTGEESTWSRIEGLNVHSQILAMLDNTRRASHEIEKSAKTSRGWWVVWMRLPPSSQTSAADLKSAAEDREAGQRRAMSDSKYTHADEFDTEECRIAVLVRKASDWTPPKQSGARSFSGMMGWTGSHVTGGSNAGWGPTSLAGGMGFDPRRYVEGLLSLSR